MAEHECEFVLSGGVLLCSCGRSSRPSGDKPTSTNVVEIPHENWAQKLLAELHGEPGQLPSYFLTDEDGHPILEWSEIRNFGVANIEEVPTGSHGKEWELFAIQVGTSNNTFIHTDDWDTVVAFAKEMMRDFA